MLTGANGGYDVDLRSMAARGIVLLSHSQAIEDGDIVLAGDLEQHLAKGNESFESFKKAVDEYVTKAGLDVPEEQESEVSSNITKAISTPVSHLNLKDDGVSAIVWASGSRYDFDWVKLPTFDDGGEPLHRRGVTQFPGIYFLGLRWLYAEVVFSPSRRACGRRGVFGGTNCGVQLKYSGSSRGTMPDYEKRLAPSRRLFHAVHSLLNA